jgi:hypothetical protein
VLELTLVWTVGGPVLSPRNYEGKSREAAASLIPMFRDYLHYHIKCSKAYLVRAYTQWCKPVWGGQTLTRAWLVAGLTAPAHASTCRVADQDSEPGAARGASGAQQDRDVRIRTRTHTDT